jgi:hypothetical protein
MIISLITNKKKMLMCYQKRHKKMKRIENKNIEI